MHKNSYKSRLYELISASLASRLQFSQMGGIVQGIEHIHISRVDVDLGDAGVGEGQVPGPCQRDMDEGADDGAQRCSVADDGVGFAVAPLNDFIHRFHAPCLAVFEGFAVREFQCAGVVVHGFDHAGPDFFDFVVGLSFPVTEGEFHETAVRFQGKAMGFCNASGSVGGPHKGACDDAVQVDAPKAFHRLFRLGKAFFA